MIDRLIYNCSVVLDNSISFVETGVVKMVEWCWHTRVKLLKEKEKIMALKISDEKVSNAYENTLVAIFGVVALAYHSIGTKLDRYLHGI